MEKRIHEKLAHLTLEQINELIERYYGEEKVKNLIEEYQIDESASKLCGLFPMKELEDEFCRYCQIPLYAEWNSKTEAKTFGKRYKNKHCLKCGHRAEWRCNCIKCQEAEAEEGRRKKERIYANYKRDNIKFKNIEELSTIDKIYLGGLLQCALSEDMTIIEPINTKNVRLAPTGKLCQQILEELLEKQIITVDIESSADAFDWKGEYFDKNAVYYRVNVQESELEESIRAIFLGEYEIEPEECLKIWKELALHEVIEYLLISMRRVGFSFNAGERTIQVFSKCLETFSVSQIYQIIYGRIAGATKYFQEGNVSRRHAANSVITKCEDYYNRAAMEQWKLKSYHRDKECPESAMSRYLFGKIIKLDRIGFEVVPNIADIIRNSKVKTENM